MFLSSVIFINIKKKKKNVQYSTNFFYFYLAYFKIHENISNKNLKDLKEYII